METNEAYCHIVARLLSADGKMDEAERAFLEETLTKKGLDDDAKKRVRHFENVEGSRLDLEDAVDLVKTLPVEERQELRDDLLGATLADGKIDALEQVLMEELSESLDL